MKEMEPPRKKIARTQLQKVSPQSPDFITKKAGLHHPLHGKYFPEGGPELGPEDNP